MLPPGPPAGSPPANQELPPGPPAEDALPLIPADLAHVHPSRQASLADHTPQQTPEHGASEHVLITLHDVAQLRRCDQPNNQTLHDEARHWTNVFAEGRYHSPEAQFAAGVPADLAARWSNWKMYIAKHKYANKIIGSGVVSFTAEFIEGTNDSNRGGIPRLDLVLRHSDGGYVRLHPGSTRKRDAAPRFFPSSAPEHAAAYEWRTPGTDGVFTATRANQVPQTDVLGKEDVWQTVQSLKAQGLIGNERDGPRLDITDGTHLRWWLWVCNLGKYTRRVIGTGVRNAYIAMNMDHEAVFTFVRADTTECMLRLCCIDRGRGRELRINM